MSAVEIDVAIGCDGWPDEADLSAMAQSAFSSAVNVLELEEQFNVSLLFTSDAAVQALNREWRGKDKPTNVLSFPAGESPTDNDIAFLGDIALALETVERGIAYFGRCRRH